MSSNRGSQPGERRGGRKKGVPNKRTAELVARVESSGLTPLDYLLQVMRDESLDRATRVDAAKAAAPYVNPRLQPIDPKTGSAAIQFAGRIELVPLSGNGPSSAPA